MSMGSVGGLLSFTIGVGPRQIQRRMGVKFILETAVPPCFSIPFNPNRGAFISSVRHKILLVKKYGFNEREMTFTLTHGKVLTEAAFAPELKLNKTDFPIQADIPNYLERGPMHETISLDYD